jgi:peptidoglycan/LPS O-acetylase OafA/YrhL
MNPSDYWLSATSQYSLRGQKFLSDANTANNRIPSLDGLRAISILLVIVSHFHYSPNLEHSRIAQGLMPYGSLGVRIFFVISGYLITSLLISEIDKTGSISLPRFYFRRTLRIFPAYYVYLGLSTVIVIAGFIPGDEIDFFKKSLPFAAAYLSNYFHWGAWLTSHTWSLSVEEQFYLLWPMTLKLAGKRKGIMIATAVLILCPLARVSVQVAKIVLKPHFTDYELGWTFETAADAIAIGCLLALAYPWLQRQKVYQRIQNTRLFFLIPLFVLIDVPFSSWYGYGFMQLGLLLVNTTLLNVCIALTLDWCVSRRNRIAAAVLNWRPLMFVGVLSYSLYLWQQMFMSPYGKISIYVRLAALFVMALGSYYLVEQPALKVRQKFERKLFKKKVQKAVTV